MPKKQLPKRVVPFKMEKHPTAERLDALRSQGIDSLEDLENLTTQSVAIADLTANTTVDTPTDIITEAMPATTSVGTGVGTDIGLDIAAAKPLDEVDKTVTTQQAEKVAEVIQDSTSLLQESHSLSAQLIYQLMYELASRRNRDTIRIGTKELLEKTSIKSHVTVRRAIDELIVKGSIKIIEANQGKIPPVYQIGTPEAILIARQEAGLTIDADTKFAFQNGKRVWPTTSDKSISTPTHIATATAVTTDRLPTEATEEMLIKICEQLGVGFRGGSAILTKLLVDYPLPHIIIGICRSIEKTLNQPIDIADCQPEIENHYQLIQAFPEKMLTQVAYDHFTRIMERRK
ncbi:MAG: hypothetical protein AB1489_36140 [Acidobacteriota bacterium]